MRYIIVAVCLFASFPAGAECPKGTEQTVNEAGVPNCITVVPKPLPPAAVSPQSCPAGSVRFSESNGETVCRQIDTGRQFLNQNVSCPLGTFPTLDLSGNRVCQR